MRSIFSPSNLPTDHPLSLCYIWGYYRQAKKRVYNARAKMINLSGKRTFPCPVCASPLLVKQTKKAKPYLVCDPCGTQVFVRGPGGIAAFNRLVERGVRED